MKNQIIVNKKVFSYNDFISIMKLVISRLTPEYRIRCIAPTIMYFKWEGFFENLNEDRTKLFNDLGIDKNGYYIKETNKKSKNDCQLQR
jgi:hypothetical protein